MDILSSELRQLIQTLIASLTPEDCLDAEEYRLAREFEALPLGWDLWSRCFLTADGESIKTGWEPGEIERHRGELIGVVASAARHRYPQFAKFIPDRPPDGVTCLLCAGSKTWGQEGGTKKPAVCFLCAGLGWITRETLTEISKSGEDL
jgi:hypothetical protein